MSWIDGATWDNGRGQRLVELIARSYTRRSALEKLVDDSGIDRVHLPGDGAALVYQWHELIRKAQDVGKLRVLIGTIIADKSVLRAQIDQLIDDEPGQNAGNPQNAYDVRLIGPGKRPMINRVDLRTNLKELFGTDRVVLTVRGQEKSGKSHSYLLMSHVARGHQGYELVMFNYGPPSSGDTAKQLLAMMCSRLRLDDVTNRPQWTTATKFAGEMMDDFVGLYRDKFRGTETTRILVIDGLERFQPGSDVYSLAARLALEVAQDQLPNTQLVLIGYSDVLDPAIDFAVIPEVVKDITLTDLQLYFDGLAKDMGRELTPARLSELVQVSMTGEPGIAALSDRVKRQALDLIAGP